VTQRIDVAHDPRLDLVLERVIDVPRELVWRAWTTPELLKRWFTPAPYRTSECEIDLRPGGVFRNVITSPEGENFPYVGCYLEVVPNERLVWTIALLPGFRPAPIVNDVPQFTAILTLTPEGAGTRYRVVAKHRDEASSRKHDEMGFQDGWGAALDQLVALAKTL